MRRHRVTDALFLAALFSVSFIGLRWRVGGMEPKLADFFMAAFVVAYAVEAATERRRPTRPTRVVLGFAAALTVAYLAAAPVIDGRPEVVQYCKGFAYFALHFAFVASGVDLLASRPARFFRVAFGCLLVGLAANGAYAGLQLFMAGFFGRNVDTLVLSPVTGRPARSLGYGLMYGPDTLRGRGLTRDPNHLGAMLLIPTLTLVALSAWQPRVRRPRVVATTLAGLLVVLVLTLSRSAGIGLTVGVVFLGVTAGRRLLCRAVLLPTVAAALVLALIAKHADTFERVLGARLGIYGFAGRQHFRTYELIGPALSDHPFFGVGLNNFDLTYAQRILGTREASHSFYVQSLIETGLVGTTVFALFLGYVGFRLYELHVVARAGDSLGAKALAAALGAGFAATLSSNAFYMTMSFSYFFAFLVFVLAAATCYAPSSQVAARPPGISGSPRPSPTQEVRRRAGS